MISSGSEFHHVRDDLSICAEYLLKARHGISLNLLVFREPTHTYRSDASEHGIGGYSLSSGHAWRYEIPPDCWKRVSLNTLEFIGCLITIWVDILGGRTLPESCLLCQTDSSSAEGWLRKSNFEETTQPAQMIVARQLAKLVLSAYC